MGKGYYVGLDMGTGSVGWAVTDESYQILRRHGKAMWGVRLFESAKTAEERRMFRTGRRRLDRRGWRIEILQEIFAEEISRVDPGFFLRMKESKYYPEDKRDIQGNCPELPYTLFVDKTFTDKDFHKKYPTIYHLRKMLMETEDTPDIRLVYLALHHMMKHRGHFLLSGDISQVTEFKNTFNQFIENIRNEGMDFEIELDESAVQMIEETLKDKNLTRSAKKAKLVKGLNAKNVRDKAFLTLLSGGTVKLSDLFGMEELNEGERPKISFADNRYEEYAAVVEMELGELYYIVESAKAVYDWAILSDILGGSTSVSDAKVRAYEKHKADLKYLKAVVKEYFPKEVYNAVFVESSDKLNNYPAYIGIEKKISLDVMKYVDHVDNELEQGCRSIDFIYREWLGEIAGICKVMDYKMICCSRYASEMNRVNWKPVKEIIKKEIAHNPYLGYKELVTKDLSLDIEIELEYLIESEQLIRRKPNHKNPRYRWEARIK